MGDPDEKECACVSDDAYECFQIRYAVPGCFGVSCGPEEPESCWCYCHYKAEYEDEDGDE